MHTQDVASVPRMGFSQKYNPTAAPMASTEQRVCRRDRPMNMDSW